LDDFNPINIGDSWKSAHEVLTRKPLSVMLSTVKAKPTTRDWLLLVLIAAAILALGLWESSQGLTPNH